METGRQRGRLGNRGRRERTRRATGWEREDRKDDRVGGKEAGRKGERQVGREQEREREIIKRKG